MMENGEIVHFWACWGPQGAAVSGPHPMACPQHMSSPLRGTVPRRGVTMAGLYIFSLGLVLPQFLMAFAGRGSRQSSVSIRGILLP